MTKANRRPFRDLVVELEADPRRRAMLDEERRAIGAAVALARERNARGMTQTEVAKTMNVSQKRVSTIEREGNPELATLRKYAAAIGGTLQVSIAFDDGSVAPIAAE